jgi:Sec-independent protein translocase protein TatA
METGRRTRLQPNVGEYVRGGQKRIDVIGPTTLRRMIGSLGFVVRAYRHARKTVNAEAGRVDEMSEDEHDGTGSNEFPVAVVKPETEAQRGRRRPWATTPSPSLRFIDIRANSSRPARINPEHSVFRSTAFLRRVSADTA